MDPTESTRAARELCVRAEAKLVRLRQQLQREQRTLAGARVDGRRPRGMLAGLVLGMFLTTAGISALYYAASEERPAGQL